MLQDQPYWLPRGNKMPLSPCAVTAVLLLLFIFFLLGYSPVFGSDWFVH